MGLWMQEVNIVSSQSLIVYDRVSHCSLNLVLTHLARLAGPQAPLNPFRPPVLELQASATMPSFYVSLEAQTQFFILLSANPSPWPLCITQSPSVGRKVLKTSVKCGYRSQGS